MSGSAKRVYTELKNIDRENYKNPNLKKFLIDKTPFDNEDSGTPTIVKENNNQYYIVLGRILPTSNIYNRSAFNIKIKIPVAFPFKPPEVEMLTRIYHPNIGPEGKICLPLLRSTETWKTTNTLIDVINATVDYIDHPNIDEAYLRDIADEYTNKKQEFERKAAEMVGKNMVSRQ